MKNIVSSKDFLSLSAWLNYQLSGDPCNWNAILSLVTDGKYDEEMSGKIDHITETDMESDLDGLFKHKFDHEDKGMLQSQLNELYKDKTLMCEAAVAFIAILAHPVEASTAPRNLDSRRWERSIPPPALHCADW